MPSTFLALDLGAESGRGVLGTLTDRKIELTEIHRFPNGPVRILDTLHWDTLRLWAEAKNALTLAVRQAGKLAGLGIDTWGVDFGLLGKNDCLLGCPVHYRDARTNGIFDKAFKIVPREQIFEYTGLQFMQLNPLYQLLAMKLQGSPILEQAETMLLTPDLFNFWFTGQKAAEFTIATTTQAYDPRRAAWADDLIAKMSLPRRIFPEIIATGTVLDPIRRDIAEETGAAGVRVIATAEHDTASAVAAVPAVGNRPWAFLSSGTWSLMGTEVDKPIITPKSLAYNFTNEGCFGGTFRFLKNIMGLWLVQECRRTWERAGKTYSYTELTDLAAKAKPFLAILNPDDPSFLAPGDMPTRIADFCKRTGQQVPTSPGEFVRVCSESLAMSYRRVLARMEECTGQKLEVIHAVGGGIQNRQLCQWAADATGRPVIAGPVEATATGNIAIQAIATGVLPDLKAARQLINNSFDLETYEPKDTARWEEPYRKFEQLQG
jgi:rhamnulokinase